MTPYFRLHLNGLCSLLVTGLLLSACQHRSDYASATGEFSRLYSRNDRRTLEVASHTATLETTRTRVSKQISEHDRRITVEDDDELLDDLEDQREVLTYLDELMARVMASAPTPQETMSTNLQVERILNMLETEESGNSPIHKFPNVVLGIVPTALFGHSITLPTAAEMSKPVGEKQATKESPFLFSPGRDTFHSQNALAGMTPLEIAQLDVSPDHPAWYRDGEQPSDPVRHFERWQERGVTAALQIDGDLPRGSNWTVDRAGKVFFIDKVYKSATSAKCRVEDAYGVEWKLKWGDEVQSEPVSSRLYLLTGARMTDLVFAGGGGPEEMILILAEKGEYEDRGKKAKTRRKPESVPQFITSLDDFYGFDLQPYIHSYGVIDQDNVSSLLQHLPADARKAPARSELIGRRWVSFREYSAELRPKGFIRTVGGAPLTDFAASNDRAARGLYLFSLWLSARDSKDDNNKAYFIREANRGSESEMRIGHHFEGHHDLGVTLGSVASAADINELAVGDEFMRQSFSGGAIKSRQTFVYRPKAYSDATWSDMKWMADRIARLTMDEIRLAVATSKWPDFMQECLSYKLIARRNQIARMFQIEHQLDASHIAPPTITIDLRNPEKIRKVERQYQLAPGSLARTIASEHPHHSGLETVVLNGRVVDSDDSALIHQLVIQRHPAGLFERYRRFANEHPKALDQ